jgi:hypothetical protein
MMMEMLLTIFLIISGLILIIYLHRTYQIKERREASDRRVEGDRRHGIYGRRINHSEYFSGECRRGNISDRRIGALTRRRFFRRELDASYVSNSFR